MAEPALPLTGACLCGAVRFTVDRPLLRAGYCHCTRCRRRSGAAASPQARVAPGSFRVVSGEEHVREWDPGDGGFLKASCAVCGSQLFSRHPSDAEVLSVRLGAFHTDPGVRPSFRQHVASAAPWEPLPDDGLPRYEGAAPPAG